MVENTEIKEWSITSEKGIRYFCDYNIDYDLPIVDSNKHIHSWIDRTSLEDAIQNEEYTDKNNWLCKICGEKLVPHFNYKSVILKNRYNLDDDYLTLYTTLPKHEGQVVNVKFPVGSLYEDLNGRWIIESIVVNSKSKYDIQDYTYLKKL